MHRLSSNDLATRYIEARIAKAAFRLIAIVAARTWIHAIIEISTPVME